MDKEVVKKNCGIHTHTHTHTERERERESKRGEYYLAFKKKEILSFLTARRHHAK
jgi:hypothetical protein